MGEVGCHYTGQVVRLTGGVKGSVSVRTRREPHRSTGSNLVELFIVRRHRKLGGSRVRRGIVEVVDRRARSTG